MSKHTIRGMRSWGDGWRVSGHDGVEYYVEFNSLSQQWTIGEPGGDWDYNASQEGE